MVRILLVVLMFLFSGNAFAVELDGDANDAIDVDKGGTNSTTGIGAATGLGLTTGDNLTNISGDVADDTINEYLTAINVAMGNKEDDLGAPAGDGYVLTSTTAKVRSWVNSLSNVTFILGSADPTTPAGALGRSSDRIAMANAAQTATLYYNPTDDTATNGDTAKGWSADKVYDQLALKQSLSTFPVSFCVAISDETTDLTASATKVTFRAPYAFTVSSLRASVNTAPVGATIIIDVNEAGTTLMTTNKLSIDASEETSTTAATAHALTDTSIADDAEMTIDIDQIGSTTAGKGAKVCFYGTRSL